MSSRSNCIDPGIATPPFPCCVYSVVKLGARAPGAGPQAAFVDAQWTLIYTQYSGLGFFICGLGRMLNTCVPLSTRLDFVRVFGRF